jgi:hypothetical protein
MTQSPNPDSPSTQHHLHLIAEQISAVTLDATHHLGVISKAIPIYVLTFLRTSHPVVE